MANIVKALFVFLTFLVGIAFFLGDLGDLVGLKDLDEHPLLKFGLAVALTFLYYYVPWRAILRKPLALFNKQVEHENRIQYGRQVRNRILDMFANIAHWNPCPDQNTTFMPGRSMQKMRVGVWGEGMSGKERAMAFMRYQLEGDRIELICNYISGSSSYLVHSCEFRIRCDNETFSFVRDRFRDQFYSHELYEIGPYIFWKPEYRPEYNQVPKCWAFLCVGDLSHEYTLIAVDGIVPIEQHVIKSLIERDKEATTQVFSGARICWRIHLTRLAVDMITLDYDPADYRYVYLHNAGQLVGEGWVDVDGTLQFEGDGSIAIRNAKPLVRGIPDTSDARLTAIVPLP